MPDLLTLYHLLPYPGRVAMASARGMRLRHVRYSRDTDRWVAEALAREHWTPAQWEAWQGERLSRMLWHAAKDVPYYRQLWEVRRRRGDTSSVESLSNWPVLRKEAIRTNPKSLLADGVALGAQITEHTSGSSGTPLTLWMSRDAVCKWYALFEARWRGWYGLTRTDRWGILGGQLVAPYQQNRPPFWVWNAGLNQLYLSSYHLRPDTIGAYFKAIRDHCLVYLLGYASSLSALAELALEQGLAVPSLRAVISNAEPLYAHQRDLISRAFRCPVHDTYGLSENVCAASECNEGALHLWPEVGVTEILDDREDIPVQQGETGRLVCTGLLNSTMPLVRYEVGDRAATSTEQCGCGRCLPILTRVEGRIDDVIVTPDGRRIGRLDPVFKADMPVREAQLIQEESARLRVKIVPAEGYDESVGRQLVARLRQRLGPLEITLELVQSIPRSANGKFRAVISKTSGAR